MKVHRRPDTGPARRGDVNTLAKQLELLADEPELRRAYAALSNLTPERMALLKSGEAYVWSSKATDDSFSKGAVKLRCRPRVTQHGGATRVAVKD